MEGPQTRFEAIDEEQNIPVTVDNGNEIENLKNYIKIAEDNLEAAKVALANITGEAIETYKSSQGNKVSDIQLKSTADGKIVEGVFDGENMIGPDEKKFSVPANYASKSKLIEGDKLKLTVAEDGSFIFKQIGPAERKRLVGLLNFTNNAYQVESEGKTYDLLYASVTYHKAKPGDQVTIVVPAGTEGKWAALENVIHDVPTEEVLVPEQIGVENGQPVTEMPIQPPAEPIPPAPVEAPAPQIKTNPYVAEANDETGILDKTNASTMPEESFLPRTQDDTTNSLGEAPSSIGEATELEI